MQFAAIAHLHHSPPPPLAVRLTLWFPIIGSIRVLAKRLVVPKSNRRYQQSWPIALLLTIIQWSSHGLSIQFISHELNYWHGLNQLKNATNLQQLVPKELQLLKECLIRIGRQTKLLDLRPSMSYCRTSNSISLLDSALINFSYAR